MRKDAAKKLKAQDKHSKKKKSEALKQKAAERREIVTTENKQSIAQVKELGLLDDNDSVDEIVKSLENVEPLYNIDKTQDRIDNKIFAIMLMEGMIRERQGVLLPNFSMAGKLIGRSRSYMHGLWQDRDEITAQKNTILNNGLKMVRVKMTMSLLKMTNALDRMTVDDWAKYFKDPKDMRNFIDFYDKLIIRIRLLADLSTENVDHQHKHTGKVELVPTDQM